MGKLTESEPYQVVWLVRRLFRAFARKSDENLEELGVSAAHRAVLEFLHPDKKLSVPEIAGRYKVSRQHVQITANSLLEKGLLVAKDNPRHKRSPLMMMSAKGRRLFGTILVKDEEAVKWLFSGIPKGNVKVTRQTLESLLGKLEDKHHA